MWDKIPVKAMLFTVGHSTHSIETLLELLSQHRVGFLADVRSKPFSSFSPQFNQDALRRAIESQFTRYVFMGEQLGGQPNGPEMWREGRPCFVAMSSTPEFQAGLERLLDGCRQGLRICLLCSEEDPALCHRHRLVGTCLQSRGIGVTHIRRDGSLEGYEQAQARVPAVMRRQWQPELF